MTRSRSTPTLKACEALGWRYEIAGVPPVSLLEAGLPVHVRMLRESDGTGEKVPQAYLPARKP